MNMAATIFILVMCALVLLWVFWPSKKCPRCGAPYTMPYGDSKWVRVCPHCSRTFIP